MYEIRDLRVGHNATEHIGWKINFKQVKNDKL